jgi:hypothetical protein
MSCMMVGMSTARHNPSLIRGASSALVGPRSTPRLSDRQGASRLRPKASAPVSSLFSTPGSRRCRQLRGGGIDGHRGQHRRGLPDAMHFALAPPACRWTKATRFRQAMTWRGRLETCLATSTVPNGPDCCASSPGAPDDCAEDIVQQVFTRMAGKTGDQAAAIASPGAYLREAARNLRRDEARSAMRTSRPCTSRPRTCRYMTAIRSRRSRRATGWPGSNRPSFASNR